MAAYAALASLAQTTNLDTNHALSHFSINAKQKISSTHECAITLLTFLEEYPERANRWEAKMRDFAHETGDVIEQFLWRQAYFGGDKTSRLKFEEEFGNVMENFCLIAGDVMDERPAYPSHSLLPSASSRIAPTPNGVAIGLDDDVMAIKDRLCGLSSKLKLIPILGMGGIGKTTLARIVYDDPLIMYHFHKLMEENMSRLEMDDVSILAEKVYKNLKGRRYLMVMDDVWSTKVWDDVRNVFPDDGNGSRIMLTTRLADVAVYPDLSSPPHEMRFMNDSQSWDLLKRNVFVDRNCPPELEDVGKKIARSCGGLPLALVLVAGFLSEVNKNPSSWEEISENVNPIVGQELEGILSLSYTHLPHHLRSCFLFMAMFPEDENIRASRLIRLWLAEGFLKHQNGCGKSLEEKAEEYLEDLVKRNLVIVTSKKSDGKIKCCSLHAMVRDLCIRKAHDERFLRVLDGSVVRHGTINERHVSFINETSDMNNIWAPTIHTILYFHLKNFPCVTSFLRCYRLLRIFDAMSENSISLPSEVFDLFHLRYLALTCPSIPSAISNLMNLQTLIILPISLIVSTFYNWKRYWPVVCDPSSHFSLPLEIWRMPQLRHLILHRPYTLPLPPNGSNTCLENLQTLSYIKNLVWNENMLQMIPNIKRLGLVYETNTESHLNLLKHLFQLEKLKVYGVRSFYWQRQNPNFPSTLKKLTLVGLGLSWEDMSVIGSLPNLQVLKLRDHACRGETWETVDGEFPDLRYLLIDGPMLQQWITESSHFPRLECLVLRSYQLLWEIPQGIGEIPTLGLIEADYRNKLLVKSAMKIQEDQESYGYYGLHVSVIHSHEEFT